MGDIAEGLIDGTFDYITGEYLGEGFGCPRTLDKDLNFPNKPSALQFQVNGIKKFLIRKGIESDKRFDFCFEYVNGVLGVKCDEGTSWKDLAKAITDHSFKKFASYTQKQIIK